jgi:hypothetical protein
MNKQSCGRCHQSVEKDGLISTDRGPRCAPCAQQLNSAITRATHSNQKLSTVALILCGLAMTVIGAHLVRMYMVAQSATHSVNAAAGTHFPAPTFQFRYLVPIVLGLAALWYGITYLLGLMNGTHTSQSVHAQIAKHARVTDGSVTHPMTRPQERAAVARSEAQKAPQTPPLPTFVPPPGATPATA